MTPEQPGETPTANSDTDRITSGAAVTGQPSRECDGNVIELARQRGRLVRPVPVLTDRTPDGRYLRASPAHYVLPLRGGPSGLRAFAYPAGGDLCVRSRTIAEHPVRHDIEWTLQLASDEPVWILQLGWAVGGSPGALTTTYLPRRLAESLIADIDSAGPDAISAVLPLTPLATTSGRDGGWPGWLVPRTLDACMQQPTRGAAQALGLGACQRAVMITARYDDLRDGTPVALTVAALRPEEFRITIASSDQPILADSAGLPTSGWSHVDGDWDF
jgi:hypothetical protein